MRLADQNASLTRDETQAQILASSVMDELVSGARTLVAVNQAPFDYATEVPWLFSVAVEPTGLAQLVAVRVLVEQQTDPQLQPAKFELVRWLPNPDYIPPATASASSTSSSSSSTSSGSGNSSGQSSGGGQR
jgi:hypothetical protein